MMSQAKFWKLWETLKGQTVQFKVKSLNQPLEMFCLQFHVWTLSKNSQTTNKQLLLLKNLVVSLFVVVLCFSFTVRLCVVLCVTAFGKVHLTSSTQHKTQNGTKRATSRGRQRTVPLNKSLESVPKCVWSPHWAASPSAPENQTLPRRFSWWAAVHPRTLCRSCPTRTGGSRTSSSARSGWLAAGRHTAGQRSR